MKLLSMLFWKSWDTYSYYAYYKSIFILTEYNDSIKKVMLSSYASILVIQFLMAHHRSLWANRFFCRSQAWIPPFLLGVVLLILCSLCSKERFGFEGEMWKSKFPLLWYPFHSVSTDSVIAPATTLLCVGSVWPFCFHRVWKPWCGI